MTKSSFLPALNLAVFSILIGLLPISGCSNSTRLTAEEHIARAKDMDAAGNLKGMVIELKNAVQKAPQNPQARLLLGHP